MTSITLPGAPKPPVAPYGEPEIPDISIPSVSRPEIPDVQASQEETPPEPEVVEREYGFDVDMFSGIYGKRLTGRFVTKILTIGEKTAAGILASRLLAGANPTTIGYLVQSLAEERAHHHYCLIHRPKWYEPTTFQDEDVHDAIAQEVRAHAKRFRDWVASRSAALQEGRDGQQPGNVDPGVVGG